MISTVGLVEVVLQVRVLLLVIVKLGVASSEVTSTVSVAVQLFGQVTVSVYIPGDCTLFRFAVVHTCDHH